MNTFRKYEFTPAQWATLQAKIQVTDEEGNKSYKGCAVHEIGFICLQWGKDAEDMQHAVEMATADALILHFNVLQEAVQPEGDSRGFRQGSQRLPDR